MLLECNEIKLLIVNLDNVSSELDEELSDLIDYKDCVFILSDKARAEQLEESIEDFSYISPTGWFGFYNTGTILRILREHNIEPYEAVYITGDSQESYNNLGVSTILLEDKKAVVDKNNLSDHWAVDITALIKCLKGDFYGYYGELWADGTASRGGFLTSTLSNEKLLPSIETDLIVFGRYFVSHDSRAYSHPFSQLILQMKNGSTNQINIVAKLFARSVNHFYNDSFLKADIITVVPPKHNKKNVLLEVINTSKNLGKDSLNPNIKVEEVLALKENYQPQKEAGSHTYRFLNVKDKFRTTKKIAGHIVLVDDIITSGATALECAKVLYEAGADKVTVLAFGASQKRSEAPMLDRLTCSSCKGGEYKIRFSGSGAFYGCSNYPKCKSSLTYKLGRRRYNTGRLLNPKDLLHDSEDLF